MSQLEFFKMIEIMLKTDEIKLGAADKQYALNALNEIRNNELSYYKTHILSFVADSGEPGEMGCDNWFETIGRYEGPNYEEYARLLFTEDYLQEVWEKTH